MRIARPWPRKTMDDYTRRRLYLRVGQVIMVAGGIMAVVHWLTHLEAFGPNSLHCGSTLPSGTRWPCCCWSSVV